MIKDLPKDESIPTTGTILLDFLAPWCGPCKMQSKILDSVDAKLSGTPNIIKIDVDSFKSITLDFNVRSVPTLILIKDGVVVQMFCGLQREENLISLLTNI